MSAPNRILLVDDDQQLRQALAEQLTGDFLPTETGTGAEGLASALAGHFDAILLDVGLPDMDGREACQVMRKNGFKSPILMLTGADTDADEVLGSIPARTTTSPSLSSSPCSSHAFARI